MQRCYIRCDGVIVALTTKDDVYSKAQIDAVIGNSDDQPAAINNYKIENGRLVYRSFAGRLTGR